MYSHRTCQLSYTAYRKFHFFSRSHYQVAELIYNYHYIRHELVSVCRIKLSVDEFRVIFLYVSASRLLQQVISRIHLHTQRVQCLHHLCHVSDDCVLRIRQLCKEMLLYRCIDGEFHLLRVDNHEFQFARMLLIQQ